MGELQREKNNLEQSIKNMEKKMKIEIVKEKNKIITEYSNREIAILDYFKKKSLVTIKEMENNMNNNIDQFKNEVMNYINA